MNNKEIVRILKNISILLNLKGENPFKSRAYINAANIISEQDIDIIEAVHNGTLSDIKGFGKALVSKITELVETGKMAYYNNLISEIPESLIDITKISTIGPKKAKLLFEEYGISNLDQLQNACESGQIADSKGFSEKSVELILNSIYHKKAAKGKYVLDAAIEEADKLLGMLSRSQFVKSIELTGRFRRFEETPKMIDFILVTHSKEELIKFLGNMYQLTISEDTIYFSVQSGLLIRIFLSSEDKFAYNLLTSTGSSEFISSFVEYCKNNGLSLPIVSAHSESEIFSSAGLEFIPPELRENGEIIQAAANNTIPELISLEDMKGMLHVHTNWSDGRNTIKDMALKARELGYSYIAICDHSRSAAYAGGLTIDRVKAQHEEIDNLNEEGLGIHILKGIESDILKDGSLDYPDSVLETFDLIVASIHSGFNMKKDDMTKRIIYALMSPYTTILGHPSGRLLLARPAYQLDIEAVIQAAAELGKVIEINCNPYRLDLSWRDVLYSRQYGLKIAINPDSHNKNTLTDVAIGVKVARKGSLSAADVINSMTYDEFIRFLKIK